MTPQELHTKLSALWPQDDDNEFVMDWRRFMDDTAVTGDYAGFATQVTQPAGQGGLYFAPKYFHDKSAFSKRVRLIQKYVDELPKPEPAQGQMRLI